ncbi:hypothetical protein ATCC19435_0904 [Lactococcus lactis subsp. lactis]|nr:hypothetical protein ATCC19435_0904 [Lactococcus lactis subsp. lactis]
MLVVDSNTHFHSCTVVNNLQIFVNKEKLTDKRHFPPYYLNIITHFIILL